MKLHQLFEETISPGKFDLDRFIKDTEFYFEHAKRNDSILWHGDPSDIPGYGIIKPFRARTSPRNSHPRLHKEANEVFKEKFGWEFRNGLFVTGWKDTTRAYGHPTVIFPVGKFEWLSNPLVHDLTIQFEEIRNGLDHDDRFGDNEDEDEEEDDDGNPFSWGGRDDGKNVDRAIDVTIHQIKNLKTWWHNEKLDDCIHEHSEIMLKCDKFYQFPVDSPVLLDIILPWMQN